MPSALQKLEKKCKLGYFLLCFVFVFFLKAVPVAQLCCGAVLLSPPVWVITIFYYFGMRTHNA